MTTKDKFLLALVRNYKHGDPRRVIDLHRFAKETESDYQEVKDIAAELKSEGSIVTRDFTHCYQLTDSGYAKYRARVEAIETLPEPFPGTTDRTEPPAGKSAPMKSFMAAVVEVLRERGPLEIFSLAGAAAREPKPVKKDELWPLVSSILRSLKRGEHGLHIVEYPTYRLKGSLPKTLPARRYVRAALEALAESPGSLRLDQLTAHYHQEYGETAVVPEYQMFLALQTEGKRLVTQAGELRVGLKAGDKPVAVAHRRLSSSAAQLGGVEPIHTKLYEENLESLIMERLDEVEPGLTLVQRQYVTPVGRIDLLCKDRKGNLVVVELKRFRASTESIIDQVTRYMGWVQQHLAKRAGAVRACIVVGKVDKKLEYSIRAIPNLRVKCLRVSLSDPD